MKNLPLAVLVVLALAMNPLGAEEPASSSPPPPPPTPPPTLTVAAVQMRSSRSLDENVAVIRKHLRDCGAKGVRVAVFPECALTGYFEDVVTKLPAEEIAKAEAEIADTCR